MDMIEIKTYKTYNYVKLGTFCRQCGVLRPSGFGDMLRRLYLGKIGTLEQFL